MKKIERMSGALNRLRETGSAAADDGKNPETRRTIRVAVIKRKQEMGCDTIEEVDARGFFAAMLPGESSQF